MTSFDHRSFNRDPGDENDYLGKAAGWLRDNPPPKRGTHEFREKFHVDGSLPGEEPIDAHGVRTGALRSSEGFEEWWKGIEPYMEASLQMLREELLVDLPWRVRSACRLKAQRGWEEHGGDIKDMSCPVIRREMYAEFHDMLVYGAAYLKKQDESRKTL